MSDSQRHCRICNNYGDHHTDKHTDYVIKRVEDLEVPISMFYALEAAVRELRRLRDQAQVDELGKKLSANHAKITRTG